MANNATVLGPSGTPTVTIPFVTASNASAAQSALNAISGQITGGTMQAVNYTGGGTLPALTGGATVGAVFVQQGASTASALPFQLSGPYTAAVLNATVTSGTSPQGVIVGLGTSNDTVVVGQGGGAVVNAGSNTQVFLSGVGTVHGANPAQPQTFSELNFPGIPTSFESAHVWLDGDATIDGSAGSTTVTIDTIAASGTGITFGAVLDLINNGNGNNIVNIAGNNDSTGGGTDVVTVGGSSTVSTAINMPAGSGTGAQASLWVIANGGTADVSSAAGQVVAFGGGGSVSVDGGASKGDINVLAPGYFKAGTGGGAILAGAINGASTEQGGGSGDNLWAIGSKTTLIAGAGSESEVGFASGTGVVFQGNLVAGASTTNMLVQLGGGDKFITGTGPTNIQAGSASIGNTFQEGTTLGAASNTATISGFSAGADTISLANPAGGVYTVGASGAGGITITTGGGNSTVTFGDGTKWTIMGATVTSSNFH